MKKLALLTAITLLSLSCKKTEVTPIPTAEFTYRASVVSGMIYFTNASVNANSYKWDFGDGKTGDDLNPSHTYTSNGSYQVSLIAVGENQNSVIVKNVSVNNVK